MKTYNYYFYGRPITKAVFEIGVPSDWEENIIDAGYTYGGFRAIERD